MALDATADGVEVVTTVRADAITIGAAAASGNAFTVTTNAGNDTVVAAGAAGFTYDGGTGVDTLQINAGVDLSAQTFTLTSVEQISLVGGGTNTVAASYISGKTFIISENGTGTGDFAIAMDQTSVDLSNLGFASSFASGTDAITIDASGVGLASTITGSAADDTITGSSGADTINAGGAADTIISSAGSDTITGGAGADTFRFDTVSNGADVIADWSSADDVLNFEGGTFTMGGADAAGAISDYYEGAAGSATAGTDYDVMVLTGAEYATSAAAAAAVKARITSDGNDGVIVYFNSTSDVATMIHDTDMGADGTVTDVATFTGITALADMAASFATGDFVVI